MDRVKRHAIWIGFAASFLAVGLPFWSIPYAAVSLPSSLPTPGLAVVAAVALLLRALGAASFRRIVGVIGASVAAAVLARVLVEGWSDPTSHNLWPFEIVIALGIGVPCALVGAVAGSAAAALVAKRSGGRTP